MIGMVVGLLSISCGVHLAEHAFAHGILRGPASYEDERGAEEIIDDAVKQRKIEVCGAHALFVDTLSNFDDRGTGWFPGRALLLADSHEAILAKLLLIQKAKISVDLSTYIFAPDETSEAVLDALRLALLRGVHVRFMIDAGGSVGETLGDQYRHLRALLMAHSEMEKSGLKVGKLDIVIFHPLGRLNTMLSNFKERLFDQVDVASETSLNWNRRSHDKIFMIDKESREDAVAIVGGRNLDNKYFGYPERDQDTYEDMEVLVTNDPGSRDPRMLSNTLGAHFQNLFCSKGNSWLKFNDFAGLSRDALEDIEGAAGRLVNTPLLRDLYARMAGTSGYDFMRSGLVSAQLSPGNEIQNLKRRGSDVFVDPNAPFVEKLYNGNSVYLQVRRLMHDADKSIDICSPYIFIPLNERECLKKWAMEKPGRKIRILSTSAATSDSALTLAAFERESAPELLREGHYRCADPKTHEISEGEFDNHDSKIQVYQYGRLNDKIFKSGKVRDHLGRLVKLIAVYGKLHAKYGVIDGRYSFIGSHNLDQRSRRLNSETAIFVDSQKIAADTTREFEKLIQKSYQYGDPDLQLMNEQSEVRTRNKLMSILAFINKHFPEAGFAN